MVLSNDEVKLRKEQLRKEIAQLGNKTGNPTAYTLADHQPYSNSPELAADKEKLKQKLEEYNTLRERVTVASLTMKKVLTFTDGAYILKYVPQKNRWDFYCGNEYLSSEVIFSEDRETCEVIVPTQNSDTHGEVVDCVYKLKSKSSPDPIVEKAQPIPCDKITEGTSTLRQDNDEYMKSLGLVLDPVYKRWRRPTTEEYDKVLKEKQVNKKSVQTKKGISFGRFLKK